MVSAQGPALASIRLEVSLLKFLDGGRNLGAEGECWYFRVYP